MGQGFTHTVICFTDRSLTKDVTGPAAAAEYAEMLLAWDHKVRVYPYRPRRGSSLSARRVVQAGEERAG